MIEVEMKFPVDDHGPIEQLLLRWQAVFAPAIDEVDSYFNAPDRDFAQTDEALRIRRIGSGNFVTYKGPKKDAETKSRIEVEVPLAEGEQTFTDFARLLVHLGYRSVADVRKRRRIVKLKRAGFAVEVCLDDVDGVGKFVELEIVAPPEQFESAKAELRGLAQELGLRDSERRSYLQLLLERGGG